SHDVQWGQRQDVLERRDLRRSAGGRPPLPGHPRPDRVAAEFRCDFPGDGSAGFIEGIADRDQELASLAGQLESAKTKAKRVRDSIAETENVRRRQALGDKLDELLADEDRLGEQIALLTNQPRPDAALPSLVEIQREAREVIGMLASNSP